MENNFKGNPRLLHNNDEAPIVKRPKRPKLPKDNPEAIRKVLADATNFEDLMIKYSQEDKETWENCLIAGAKLVLFFEFCREKQRTSNEKKNFKTKIGQSGTNNNMEKVLEVARQNNLTLDSTISVERATIAYYEDQKNISPRSQPDLILQKSLYTPAKKSMKASAS
ncbi:MAG TPA: hypothetical protein VGO21_04475 [Candidatus Paceibacterota bacterium]|jgi:hypothetical protein|nr:hypothetical protein [Candidatus Paceibacterota bacterium]